MKAVVRWGLAAIALLELGTGLWGQYAPESFYRDFPTVDLAPPFNEHLMRDFGGAQVAPGIIIAAAAVWLERRLIIVVLAAYLAFSVPHLVFHMSHLHGATPGEVLFQVVALGSAVALPVILLTLMPWFQPRHARMDE